MSEKDDRLPPSTPLVWPFLWLNLMFLRGFVIVSCVMRLWALVGAARWCEFRVSIVVGQVQQGTPDCRKAVDGR